MWVSGNRVVRPCRLVGRVRGSCVVGLRDPGPGSVDLTTRGPVWVVGSSLWFLRWIGVGN